MNTGLALESYPALIAIVLFIASLIKDFVVWKGSKTRKTKAIKLVLCDELETNRNAAKTLSDSVVHIYALFIQGCKGVILSIETRTGDSKLVHASGKTKLGGCFESYHNLPAVRDQRYREYLMDISTIGGDLLDCSRNAYQDIRYVESIRKLLIDLVEYQNEDVFPTLDEIRGSVVEKLEGIAGRLCDLEQSWRKDVGV